MASSAPPLTQPQPEACVVSGMTKATGNQGEECCTEQKTDILDAHSCDQQMVETSTCSEKSAIESEKRDKETLRLLKIRKKQELKLVRKFDRPKLVVGKECWFIVDSRWLNAWSVFVNGDEDEEEPGPLSTKDLLDEDGEPLPGLKPIIDYRTVPPIVYFIFLELYGRCQDNSPDICRYLVDIYLAPVPPEKLVKINFTAVHQAKVQVNKVRPKWVKWEREYDDDDDDLGVVGCCCGLTKQHLEAFIYWAIMCWSSTLSRRKSGRSNISYRQYRPLRKPDAAIEEEQNAAEARQQEQTELASLRDAEWVATLASNSTQRNISDGTKLPRQATSRSGMNTKKKPRKKRPVHISHSNWKQAGNPQRSDGNGSDSSTSSDDEGAVLMSSDVNVGFADRGHGSGTWLSSAIAGGANWLRSSNNK